MEAGLSLSQRLAFIGMTEADRDALAALRPVLEEHADELVAAFYRHLLGFAETRRLLSRPEVAERLRRKQREYLLSLADDPFDAARVADRVRIGETHERIGLSPRWYLGAYAHYAALLVPLVCDTYPRDRTCAEQALVALQRVLILDAQLAMEAYIERNQQELERLNRELAAVGRQLARDIELQQVELRRTTRRARAAEELASVATLVAGLAHEIGTPMGVIRGHAELLEGSVEAERDRWRLQTIREQIDRISRIIQALLSSARPREPRKDLVRLGEVIESTLSFLGEKIRRRAVRVEKKLVPVPCVLGDAEKLQQLFLNLFLNAVDAMPRGGVLRIRLEPLGPDRIEVRVGDTGVGIDEEALQRIFEPFYTSKPAGEGSGLGLVVAHSIALEHEGTIEAASEVSVGTEFRLVLPAVARTQDVP